MSAPLRTELTDEPVPVVTPQHPVAWQRDLRWQVIGGDPGHWRVGIYSPGETSRAELTELEQHDCPELFLLVEGSLTMVYADRDGALHDLPLELGTPVVLEAPHAGFCPGGAHQGVALVVERTAFETVFSLLPR